MSRRYTNRNWPQEVPLGTDSEPKSTDIEVIRETNGHLDPYPLLRELLRMKGMSMKAQYSIRDTAGLFDCSMRSIQQRVKSGCWKARDLPNRGRFLPADLEEFLGMPLLESSKQEGKK